MTAHCYVGYCYPFIIVCPFYHWHQCQHANPCLLVSLLVSTTCYSLAAGKPLTGITAMCQSPAVCMRLPSTRTLTPLLVLFCLVDYLYMYPVGICCAGQLT
jgi:hypothetical protein